MRLYFSHEVATARRMKPGEHKAAKQIQWSIKTRSAGSRPQQRAAGSSRLNATAHSRYSTDDDKTLNKLEQHILTTETNGAEPRLLICTNTRIDAGRWWRRTPLWICITHDDVIVLAAARRQYIQRFPIEDCLASHYCHTTGELVIEPGENIQFSRLAMSPGDALQVLVLINNSGAEKAQA